MKVYLNEYGGFVIRKSEHGPYFSFLVDGKPSWTKRERRARRFASEQEAGESIERIQAAGKRGVE